MLFTPENILLAGSILLFVSILAGKTGYRFGVRPQHHPVYGWYGYQIQRHQAGTSSWYHAFNGRRTFYHFIYRPFYLVAFRYELD